MTDAPAASPPTTRGPTPPASRASSPARPRLCMIDGERGRLLYRGYRIGDLVEHGTYRPSPTCCGPATGTPPTGCRPAPIPPAVLTVLRALPPTTKPMDALRTAVSAWGADSGPAVAADRRAGPGADRRSRRRRWRRSPGSARAWSRSSPTRRSTSSTGFLYQLQGRRARTPGRPGRSTPTSSSAPSTASTPRRSRPASSPRPAPTSRRRSPARSAR